MERIGGFLEGKRKNGLLRVLRPADSRGEGFIYVKGRRYADFGSNDYLGLSGHDEIKNASREALERYGAGASASRLLSGDMNIHHRLEEETARFKGKEAALLFNSGYQANVGIISALCGRGDAVFSDRLNHASIVDGILLSAAKSFRFRHNDPESLKELLRKGRHRFKKALIITETVFSMDGDRCPLREIIALKERYGCVVMADEAHATGVFGKTGSGVAEEDGLTEKTDLIMGTFSKAPGGFGAYVACSSAVKDYLINSCRSFIYSTALPPSVVASDLAGLRLIKAEPHRRRTLLERAGYFRGELQKHGFGVKGSSQIVPLIIGNSAAAAGISLKLREAGYWALPIRPPTVPAGESRLRFSLSYYHKKEMLAGLISDIRKICRGW